MSADSQCICNPVIDCSYAVNGSRTKKCQECVCAEYSLVSDTSREVAERKVQHEGVCYDGFFFLAGLALP